MSLSLKNLEVVNVKDPRVITDYKSAYVYLQGASNISQKSYTTTSVSNSSLTFSCPPPSAQNLVDAKVYFQAPIRLIFQGLSTAPGQTIVNAYYDAPRAYALSSGIDVVNCTLNNFSVSNNLCDYLHPLLRYNVNNSLKNRMYSITPSYPDQSQLYSSLIGNNRNPLGSYGDTTDENVQGRGGFSQFKFISQTLNNAAPTIPPTIVVSTAPGQILTGIVDMVFTEPFFMLSPLHSGKSEVHSFLHLTTVDINITFLSQAANRFWSRSDDSLITLTSLNYTFAPLLSSGSPAFAFSGSQAQPAILFNYFTPKEVDIIPRNMISVYPYFDIQRFPTDIGQLPLLTLGQSPQRYTSNNVQLSSIPSKIFVFCRERNQDLYSSPLKTDTFATITGVSIQYFNRTGIMSSASQSQLYEMSVKNGCNMSYTQWTGGLVYSAGSFSNSLQYGTVGSVLCIDTACDLGLDSLQSPGKVDHNTFQIDVTLGSTNPNNIYYTLYIVIVNEGVFNIAAGQTSAQIGVLSSQDILDAKSKPYINYELIKDMEGGNFLTGVKDFFTEVIPQFLGKSKLASNLANLIPVIGPAVSKSVSNLGYGDGGILVDDMGGVLVGGEDDDEEYPEDYKGGRHMKRKELITKMERRKMM